jgi:hypothetical protein
MVTIFASIVGFISSIFPDLIRMMLNKSNKSHELDVLERQLKLKKIGITTGMEDLGLQADRNESKALYATYKSGIDWIDALNGTVRPMLAYSFFFLYAASKYLQYTSLEGSDEIIKHIDIIWGDEDQAIFAGIISFYYGQRAIAKLMGR